MTTIIGIKTETSVLIASDSQVTSGNVKLPFPYRKIEQVGHNILVGGSGTCGGLQQILKRSLRSIQTSKILSDDFSLEIEPSRLSSEIANTSYDLDLVYKKFESFSLLIAGFKDNGDNTLTNTLDYVDNSGAVLSVPNYYVIGSGSDLALGLLNEHYNPKMKDDEAITLLFTILGRVTQSDVYTDGLLQIYCISNGEINPCKLPEEKPKPKPKAKEKKV